ncbi:C-type lectin domain family 2 member D-like [Geothlypis trichas]
MEEPRGGSSPGCHQRGCEAVPEAELPKDLSAALLMSPQQGAVCSRQRHTSCHQEERELSFIHGVENEPPEKISATGNRHRRFPGERFRCPPMGTAVLILLLLVLVLALGVALAVQSAAPHVPVVPATFLLLLGCPTGWVGHKGVCYYFSRDSSTREQGQEQCSELNASLAIAKDEGAMDLLSRLCGNGDFWLGLRRRGERLHWGDGSSYSSRVPVLGNSHCVYLADETFRSGNCSNERPYVCSKAQAPL